MWLHLAWNGLRCSTADDIALGLEASTLGVQCLPLGSEQRQLRCQHSAEVLDIAAILIEAQAFFLKPCVLIFQCATGGFHGGSVVFEASVVRLHLVGNPYRPFRLTRRGIVATALRWWHRLRAVSERLETCRRRVWYLRAPPRLVSQAKEARRRHPPFPAAFTVDGVGARDRAGDDAAAQLWQRDAVTVGHLFQRHRLVDTVGVIGRCHLAETQGFALVGGTHKSRRVSPGQLLTVAKVAGGRRPFTSQSSR